MPKKTVATKPGPDPLRSTRDFEFPHFDAALQGMFVREIAHLEFGILQVGRDPAVRKSWGIKGDVQLIIGSDIECPVFNRATGRPLVDDREYRVDAFPDGGPTDHARFIEALWKRAARHFMPDKDYAIGRDGNRVEVRIKPGGMLEYVTHFEGVARALADISRKFRSRARLLDRQGRVQENVPADALERRRRVRIRMGRGHLHLSAEDRVAGRATPIQLLNSESVDDGASLNGMMQAQIFLNMLVAPALWISPRAAESGRRSIDKYDILDFGGSYPTGAEKFQVRQCAFAPWLPALMCGLMFRTALLTDPKATDFSAAKEAHVELTWYYDGPEFRGRTPEVQLSRGAFHYYTLLEQTLTSDYFRTQFPASLRWPLTQYLMDHYRGFLRREAAKERKQVAAGDLMADEMEYTPEKIREMDIKLHALANGVRAPRGAAQPILPAPQPGE